MNKNLYACQKCGSQFNKWSGQCSSCNSWNTIIEESINNIPNIVNGKVLSLESLNTISSLPERLSANIKEIDRVLGGGMVLGSVILLGGEPGIGKSTLVLQLASSIQKKCLYISGEESIEQIRLRAHRLAINHTDLNILIATNLEDIITTIKKHKNIDLIIIDSIQTMYSQEAPSSPGTVTQVRICAHKLINIAKQYNIILLLIGHITKDGQIAGPKVLEHMVDTVLYFEGETTHQFRILRSVKNRFGAANEIGIFAMQENGLQEVQNPSFISEYDEKISGTTIFAGMEGTRPILIEIQALVAQTNMATPRRAVVGWDTNRLAMIIAVLNSRYGIFIGNKEIYLNVAGGIKIQDPAADLAIMVAILSATLNIPSPKNTVIFGEVALSGAVRKVSHSEIRMKEALRMGFNHAIAPVKNTSQLKCKIVNHVTDLKKIIFLLAVMIIVSSYYYP